MTKLSSETVQLITSMDRPTTDWL